MGSGQKRDHTKLCWWVAEERLSYQHEAGSLFTVIQRTTFSALQTSPNLRALQQVHGVQDVASLSD